MAWSKPSETAGDAPVLHTPRGISPRGLRSDAFTGRPAQERPMPVRQEDTEELSALVEQPPPEAPEARDWAFGVPESAPEHSSRESLIDPDANWRHQAGQRAPAEIPLPQSARERFSENWERLASSPQGETRSRSRMRRKLESSKVSGWMFSGGRFELNAVAGTLMLLILLVSAFVYGRRLLTPSEPKADPPAKTNGN